MSGWFVELALEKGGTIHVRPDMVKAVYLVKEGPPAISNIVVDGHDFNVVGDPAFIMRAVQFDVHAEEM